MEIHWNKTFKEWLSRRSYVEKPFIYAFLLLLYIVGAYILFIVGLGGLFLILFMPFKLFVDGLVIEAIIFALLDFLAAGLLLASLEYYHDQKRRKKEDEED